MKSAPRPASVGRCEWCAQTHVSRGVFLKCLYIIYETKWLSAKRVHNTCSMYTRILHDTIRSHFWDTLRAHKSYDIHASKNSSKIRQIVIVSSYKIQNSVELFRVARVSTCGVPSFRNVNITYVCVFFFFVIS